MNDIVCLKGPHPVPFQADFSPVFSNNRKDFPPVFFSRIFPVSEKNTILKYMCFNILTTACDGIDLSNAKICVVWTVCMHMKVYNIWYIHIHTYMICITCVCVWYVRRGVVKRRLWKSATYYAPAQLFIISMNSFLFRPSSLLAYFTNGIRWQFLQVVCLQRKHRWRNKEQQQHSCSIRWWFAVSRAVLFRERAYGIYFCSKQCGVCVCFPTQDEASNSMIRVVVWIL